MIKMKNKKNNIIDHLLMTIKRDNNYHIPIKCLF